MSTIDIIAAVLATIASIAIILLVAVVRAYMDSVMNDKEPKK
ncbi:MAG: hypothetical protein U0L52_04400 [Bacteroidaceae bacterium]|nr:hypothetical protein [Bacteroidaceae bacterium]